MNGRGAEIDVVIPLYNGKPWIAETVTSVQRQSLAPKRIIVVDDGSADGSPEMVERMQGVTFLRNCAKGPASARGFGFARSTAPFIAFLDQDDLWHPTHLERLAALLAVSPSAPAAAAGLQSFQDGSLPSFDLHDAGHCLFDPWDIYPTHDFAYTPGTLLVRREACAASNGWLKEHDGMSDYSFFMRLALNHPLLYSKAKTVAYRRHLYSATCSLRKSASQYLSLSLKVDDDLLKCCLARCPDAKKKETAQRRNSLAHIMSCSIISLSNNDRAGLRDSLKILAAGLSCESDAFRKSLLYYLLYMQSNFSPSGDAMVPYYSLLLEAWPGTDRRTRSILQNIIMEDRPGKSFYLSHLARKPWQATRLLFLLKAVLCRFPGFAVRR